MKLSQQRIAIGNKVYKQTIREIHTDAEVGKMSGAIKFAGEQMRVWLVNGDYWTACKSEAKGLM